MFYLVLQVAESRDYSHWIRLRIRCYSAVFMRSELRCGKISNRLLEVLSPALRGELIFEKYTQNVVGNIYVWFLFHHVSRFTPEWLLTE